MVNQYCAHTFGRNWQLRKRENDRRQYFMINLHERMLPTSAGVEPATSWSPVRRRILLRNGMGKSILLWKAPKYRVGHAYTISGEVVHWTPFRQKLVTANLEAVEGANDRSKYMCFMINRSICEDRMHDPDHLRLMRPPTWHYLYFFFSGRCSLVSK